MKKEAVRGALWVLIDTAGGQLISFVAFLVLARLLLPEDYGVVTFVAALVAVPSIIVNEGFADILVQRQDLTEQHINTAFWTNVFLSLIFVMLLQGMASWIADFTGKPTLEPILRWLSLQLITIALVAIATGLYRRRLQYSTFALRTFIATTSGSVVAIVMAILGYEIWALVALQLVTGVVATVVMWYGLGWRPKLEFSAAAFRDMYPFVSRLMIANATRFVTEKADVVIIGIFLDAKSLGFYYLISRLLTTVVMITLAPVDQVMMPVLSRMQGDQARLNETYINMVWAASALWVPAVAGMGIVAPLLIPLLFGEQWQGAVPLMMIGSLLAITVPITRSTQNVFVSVGKPSLKAYLYLIELCFVIVAFSVGVEFGIKGAAWALVAVSFAVIPFHFAFLHRIVGISPLSVLVRYMRVIAAGAVMTAAIWFAAQWLVGFDAWQVLVLEVSVGCIVYPLVLYGVAERDVNQLLNTAFAAFRKA